MTSQYTANKFGNTYGSCKKKSEARPPSHPHPIFSGIRPFRKLALSPTRPIRINTISSTRPGTTWSYTNMIQGQIVHRSNCSIHNLFIISSLNYTPHLY